MAGNSTIDKAISKWQLGSRKAGNELFAKIESELRSIAAAKLSQESNSSLSTGDLINEAIVRLSKIEKIKFQGREHLLALASRIMRQILVDQARMRNSDKRGHEKVTLITNLPDWQTPVGLLEIDMIMDELRELDPQRADIVEMRFYGGMSVDEIAVVLGISPATVKRRWAATRIWLQSRLQDQDYGR